ncbi:MAG: hypothetical protein JNL18_10280 [Planctomycetaceae bacterium]|uniref:Hyalin n=1 Tax=Lacipirellula limnantheis TaxID=2528024 RepID=A0A517U2I0_9BACT|nr:ELWxxDGT repeat protein [Lacipirellula limnantheis]MBL9163111.1 hypothetical protein [Planctomycetaceae bacterium]QDT74827.1 hypothetical protein I41_40300 [Lacipirellula limnantheis]
MFANTLRFETLENRLAFSAVPYLVADVDDLNGENVDNGPRVLTEVGDHVFFTASDSQHGNELWKSDGTAEGTLLVKDINPNGSGLNTASRLVNVSGVLYFMANDGAHGYQLWKSDGNEAGTVMVTNSTPGLDFSFNQTLFNHSGLLLFAVYDETHLNSLWRSDGTSAGTYRIEDLYIRHGITDPRQLTEIDGFTYFIATSITNTSRRDGLWRTDGSSAGTVPLSIPANNPSQITNVNGVLYFADLDGLWKQDSITLTKLDASTHGLAGQDNLINVGGTLFFTKEDSITGIELWKSNGTPAGTVRVSDVFPGSYDSNPRQLTNVSGTLYFVANDDYFNDELWKSDGTAAGTVKVRDLMPSWSGSRISNLTNVDGTLYFRADGDNRATRNAEVWKTDGTEAGTVQVGEIRPGNEGSDPRSLVNVAGKLFFTANDGTHGPELWSLRPAPLGDYTSNGIVDGADFLAWQRAFGTSATPNGEGADGNGDGLVDSMDLQVWQDAIAPIGAMLTQSETEDAARTSRLATDSLFSSGDFTALFTVDSDVNHICMRGKVRIHRSF